MYTILYTKQFEKSLKKILKQHTSDVLYDELKDCIRILACGDKLSSSYRDHALRGDFGKAREFHVRGDILVVYERDKEFLILTLIDVGSHSQLFG